MMLAPLYWEKGWTGRVVKVGGDRTSHSMVGDRRHEDTEAVAVEVPEDEEEELEIGGVSCLASSGFSFRWCLRSSATERWRKVAAILYTINQTFVFDFQIMKVQIAKHPASK